MFESLKVLLDKGEGNNTYVVTCSNLGRGELERKQGRKENKGRKINDVGEKQLRSKEIKREGESEREQEREREIGEWMTERCEREKKQKCD